MRKKSKGKGRTRKFLKDKEGMKQGKEKRGEKGGENGGEQQKEKHA